MKPLRYFVCRCFATLLALAWTLHTGAAPVVGHSPSGAPAKVAAAHPHGSANGSRAASRSRSVARGAHVASHPLVKPSGTQQLAGKRGGKASATPVLKGKRSGSVSAGQPSSRTKLDFSGRKRVGQASYYSQRLAGRRMADGTRMRLNHHNAASKTLPLGTIAKVTNLKTGRSAVVKIQDRGPFVKGRIVDLSPATARAVGLTAKEGVAPVEVTPIEVPMPDGSVRRGDAAREPATRTQVARIREND
jgi:rare lipoprotein A